MIKEKRRSIRRPMRYTAWIGLGEGSPLRGCIVSDVSETGARLDVEQPEVLPEVFNLLLSGRGGIYRRCRIVWRSQNQVGVQFEKIGSIMRSERVSKRPEPVSV